MGQLPPPHGEELVRLADLEWLDLSDLIRIDEEWRRTLVNVARLHLIITTVIAALVTAYILALHPATTFAELLGVGGMILCLVLMAGLLVATHGNESRLLQSLRLIVLLSIIAVSLMVLLLRDLQGDYYLLYLLPLVSAAGYLGFTGGLLAGVASAIAYAIVFSLSPVSLAPGSVAALLLRMLVFILVASLLGLISERHLSLLSALRASHTQAIQLAITDTKTGLLNQSFMESRLASEISRAERSQNPVSFLAIRVNGFEEIRHERGFAVADNVLHTIGQIIQKQLRMTDVASRWGDDEFGVLLYNSDASGAENVAQRIAVDLGHQTFGDPAKGETFAVAVTQGIATFPAQTNDKSGKELVDRAFEAMAHARTRDGIATSS
jgi:diguanylate cyclase (GGDEF)-like protein